MILKKASVLSAAIAVMVLAAAYGPSSQPASAGDNQSPSVGTEALYTIVVNGTALKLDSPARLAGSTMMVPARNIAEALGAVVSYDPDALTVTAVKGDEEVTLYLGQARALRNGEEMTLDAAAVKDGNVTMVPVRFFSEAFGTVVRWDGPGNRVLIDHEANLLPSIGSAEELKALLKKAEDKQGAAYRMYGSMDTAMATEAAAPTAASGSAPQAKSKGSADHSGTNVQVAGVDEADTVKTDGEYIYQVNKQRVFIARAHPAGEMKLESSISLDTANLQPLELYVDGDRLTLIGTSYTDFPVDIMSLASSGLSEKKKLIAPRGAGIVKTMVYDIKDRAKPVLVKEVETEGNYVTSRKIGDDVYVISNRYVNRYGILNGQEEAASPFYRDSALSEKPVSTEFKDIRYFPDTSLNSYVVIAGIDTLKAEEKAKVSVYLGSGEQVYASPKNLYMTMTEHRMTADTTQERKADGSSPVVKDRINAVAESHSLVYKFLMDRGEVRFAAKGEVPGTPLNQFSMDEHDGYFRIATTKGDMWRNDEHTSKNNVYVLDESMNLAGKIEDIAPGERIYSVRFMGKRAYMVTFKKVDPLFVLDLSDPANPGILGKLKIPGYSDYLHAYDENHIIGFGKDAIEVSNESLGRTGNASESTTAFYQGMKIAMFDVSDVANPKELFTERIGDRGTDSELLRNHKALLFSKEKQLMAFPVTVAEVKEDASSTKNKGFPAYGQFTFQGAYVYKVDLTEGFRLRGKISHIGKDQLGKAGDGWYGGDSNVDRILYIDDTLYTTSRSELRASDLSTLDTLGRLMLP